MSDENSTPAPPIPMLERRRIEAAILKHVYDTIKASHGEAAARDTVANAVRRSSVEQAAEFAAKVDGKTSMQTFIERQTLWRLGDALTVDVKEESDTS